MKLPFEDLNLALNPNTPQIFILVEYAVVNTNLNLDKTSHKLLWQRMFDENVSQLIIKGNKKYIIIGDGYLATKKKR